MVKQKKLLLRCSDDSVIILAMVLDDGHFIRREGTVAEVEDEVARASVGFSPERLPILSWEEITDADLPERTFRNAWVTRGGRKIDHDMPKAREIHRDRMRAARARKLVDLDLEYLRADEVGDQDLKKDIARRKQELRDVTELPDIELAQTVDDLKQVWPSILG